MSKTVIWKADFESGKIPLSPPWSPYPQDTAHGGVAVAYKSTSTIIPNPDPARMPGTKVMRLSVFPDPKDLNPLHKGRAQVNIGAPTHAIVGVAEGNHCWYEIPIHFPKGTALNSEKWDPWQVVWQFGSGAAYNCPGVIIVKDAAGKTKFELDTMTGGLSTNHLGPHWIVGDVLMNHTHIFDVEVVWSKNPKLGRVGLTLDGNQVVPLSPAQTMATNQRDGTTWLDPTNYRHLGAKVTSTVTMDVGRVIRYTIP